MDPTTDDRIKRALQELASLLLEPGHHVSPQITKKLSQLLVYWQQQPGNLEGVTTRISAVFSRLLLELIQAQFNTKHREQDLIRRVESKGCSLRDPDLMNQIVELLTRLYKAAGQCSDTSFERQVLIKYILKELDVSQGSRKRQIERVLQTIYRCNCFHITQQSGSPSRLSLKENLYDLDELHNQIDAEIIRMAYDQDDCIRLSLDSWAYLLHGRSTPASVARLHRILEQIQTPICVDELLVAIRKSGDKLGLERHISDLFVIQDLISKMRSLAIQWRTMAEQHDDSVSDHYLDMMSDTLERLANLKYLFVARQHRAQHSNFQP